MKQGMEHREGNNMKKGKKPRNSYFPLVYNTFNVFRYYLGGLQTFLTLLSLPSPCLQVLQWFYWPLVALEVPPLHFIVYNQLSSLYNSCLLLAIVPSSMQKVTCWFVTLDFHHHGLVVTLLWQPIAQGFRNYLVVNPLFSILEANSLGLQKLPCGQPFILYPRRNAEILVQGSILLLWLKQLYFPHLIKHQCNIRNLNPSTIFH